MTIHISQPQAYSEIGQKPNQEDTLFPLAGDATKDTCVFMVCDGMGGHEHGEVASSCVAETIGKMTSQQPLCSVSEMRTAFERALSSAYNNLDALDTGTGRTMGTTLTFLALCSDGALVAHIGDSRVYQFRPGVGIVFQTRDHSLVNDLISAGEITEDEARTHPQRNVITRAVQPHQEYPAKPTYSTIDDIRQGDIFMLCCDGVVEELDNKDLTAILMSNKSLDSKVNKIKSECASRNTRDNNTCYLIEVTAVDGQGNTEKSSAPTRPSNTTNHDDSKLFSTKAIILLLVAAVICLVLSFFVFKGNDTSSTTRHHHQQENVQGTITRNH